MKSAHIFITFPLPFVHINEGTLYRLFHPVSLKVYVGTMCVFFFLLNFLKEIYLKACHLFFLPIIESICEQWVRAANYLLLLYWDSVPVYFVRTQHLLCNAACSALVTKWECTSDTKCDDRWGDKNTALGKEMGEIYSAHLCLQTRLKYCRWSKCLPAKFLPFGF